MYKFPIGDSHVHPDCSVDAKGSIDEYCHKALEMGLIEITFTTHYEVTPAGKGAYGYMTFDGKKEPSSVETVKRYTELVRNACDKYYEEGLQVRCGLEVGWHCDIAEKLQNELRQFDLDLVIGAVHEISKTHVASSIEGPDFYKGREIDEWMPEYFSSLEELASSRLFTVLAHLDLYKRHALPIYGDKLKEAHRPYVDSLFQKMVECELGLEVNTSGIRHGMGEYYPSFEILNTARRAGVTVATLGSDAHHPDQLAIDFETATQVVHELLPCTLEEDNEY
jgi:histidinol-phosphatase (PHP family)